MDDRVLGVARQVSTFIPGRMPARRSASSLPLMWGITTSVTSRSIFAWVPLADQEAFAAVLRLEDVVPEASKIARATARTCSSSSTSRIVSVPRRLAGVGGARGSTAPEGRRVRGR